MAQASQCDRELQHDPPDAFDAELTNRLESEAKAADEALKVFRSQPGFGAARLRMEKQMARLKQDLPDFRTPARSELIRRLFDMRAKTILLLVTTEKSLEHFRALMTFLKSVAWEEFTGYQREVLPARELFMAKVEEDLNRREQNWISKARKKIPAQPVAAIHKDCKSDRHTKVDGFLEQCNRVASFKVTRQHISKVAKHTSPRQFQYWQSGSDKATKQDGTNFSRIVSMDPDTFIELLLSMKLAPRRT
jgi:hypothetical protein